MKTGQLANHNHYFWAFFLDSVNRMQFTSLGWNSIFSTCCLSASPYCIFSCWKLSSFCVYSVQLVEWGRMSMCDAERRLLANALLDISNEWFILLSEACIPLHNFSIIYHYISRSKYSFMGSFDEEGPYGRGRYNWNMQPEVTLQQWRKGSQWFEINRRLAVKIVEDTTYYPKFRDFCRPACYVDEHYFPTMLSIHVPYLLANRTLTWTDWSRGGAHPATFGKADITVEFFQKVFQGQSCTYNNQPTSVCYLFARKFAPSALDPLLGLASEVFGFWPRHIVWESFT